MSDDTRAIPTPRRKPPGDVRMERAERLGDMYRGIAKRLGADDEEARIFSGCLLRADLRGKDTQGIACVPMLHSWFRSGAIRFGVPVSVVAEGDAYAIVDGGHGPGQVVATRAMEIAIRKAGETGVGAVWVRNTNDVAMASNYVMQALEHDCVGVMMLSNVPYVAPWGGREPLFATSPVAFAVPASTYDPIVHDASLSAVSHGKVVRAARDGARMSGRWLVDRAGRFTDDPRPFIVDPLDRNSPQNGAILPAGGPKGSGWLFFVDVVAGILSGMTASRDVVHDPTAEQPSTQGQWLLALSLPALGDPAQITARVDELIASVKASAPAEGFDEVSYPGERAAREERRRLRDGIPIPHDDWENLLAVAREVGF